MLDASISNGPQTVPVTSLVRARYGMGKLALPVNGPLGYVRLKHIQGIPPSGEGGGFSIQKLQVLDSLIDRLARMKNVERFTADDDGASAEQVDAMIERYSAQLHQVLQQLSASGYAGQADSLGNILNGLV
ncbi:MAG: hypothetical protein GVY14_06055 [Spirochaetes bacterium]|jgi:hypothetical protein|nr:hypothetical protein [Spirochaetota bacterium]